MYWFGPKDCNCYCDIICPCIECGDGTLRRIISHTVDLVLPDTIIFRHFGANAQHKVIVNGLSGLNQIYSIWENDCVYDGTQVRVSVTYSYEVCQTDLVGGFYPIWTETGETDAVAGIDINGEVYILVEDVPLLADAHNEDVSISLLRNDGTTPCQSGVLTASILTSPAEQCVFYTGYETWTYLELEFPVTTVTEIEGCFCCGGEPPNLQAIFGGVTQDIGVHCNRPVAYVPPGGCNATTGEVTLSLSRVGTECTLRNSVGTSLHIQEAGGHTPYTVEDCYEDGDEVDAVLCSGGVPFSQLAQIDVAIGTTTSTIWLYIREVSSEEGVFTSSMFYMFYVTDLDMCVSNLSLTIGDFNISQIFVEEGEGHTDLRAETKAITVDIIQP